MVKNRVGILVSTTGKRVDKQDDLRVDGSKKQFKYYKVIDIHKTFPATPVNTQNSVEIGYDYSQDKNLTYIPAYEVYVRGYNDRWGTPSGQSPQAYSHSYPPYPYYSDGEYIDESEFKTTISINNLSIGGIQYDYPQHEIIVRLILFYDPLEDIT